MISGFGIRFSFLVPEDPHTVAATMRPFLCLALGVLASCQANLYLENYHGSWRPPVEQAWVDPGTPDPEQSELLGRSTFVTSDGVTRADAVAAACEVGADTVVLDQEYLGSGQTSGVMPITTPTLSTTNYSGTVYSGYSSASYSGTALTTSTQTTYVPYSSTFHVVRYTAAFYRSRNR